jgi:hypothetical protein
MFGIGPIQTASFDTEPNASNKVLLTINDYKYHLTRQIVTLAAKLELSLFGWEPPLFDYVDLLSLDLREIFGEPAIGQHEGTSGVTVQIPVSRVVGGEILGIDMRTLFVAGAFANAGWIISIAGVAAGIVGFVLRRIR